MYLRYNIDMYVLLTVIYNLKLIRFKKGEYRKCRILNCHGMTGKRITLSDIAKKTGYSINTVSHALNDKSDISEETKNFIKETADSKG